MMFQWDSTMKVSIELPAATRQHRDMTEKLLKAKLNLNKQKQKSKVGVIGSSKLEQHGYFYILASKNSF